MPKSRQCYVCGRQCLLPSYDFHVSQCRDLYEKREAQKAPGERRLAPVDPYRMQQMRSILTFSDESGNRNSSTSKQSISGRQLPAKGAYHNAGNGSENVVPLCLLPCPDCGRKFNEVSYAKHVRICRKVFKQKRKVYDSAKARVKGTELAQYARQNKSRPRDYQPSGHLPKRPASRGSGGIPKWKAESIAFRKAIRAAKMMTKQIASSRGDSNYGRSNRSGGRNKPSFGSTPMPPMTTYVDPSYIKCPHCGRSFNERAAERHIPQCKNILNKPSRLVSHSRVVTATTTRASPAPLDSRSGSMYVTQSQLSYGLPQQQKHQQQPYYQPQEHAPSRRMSGGAAIHRTPATVRSSTPVITRRR